MSYSVDTATVFKKEFKRLYKKYPSLKNDLAVLVGLLKENPFIGIPLGNECFKIRLAISSKNRGKSGGARIITHVKVYKEVVYLISVYDKSEQEDISSKDLNDIISII